MRMGQARTAIFLMIALGSLASQGHSENMSDDQRLIVAADKNDTATVQRRLKAGVTFMLAMEKDARRCSQRPVTTMSKAPDS